MLNSFSRQRFNTKIFPKKKKATPLNCNLTLEGWRGLLYITTTWYSPATLASRSTKNAPSSRMDFVLNPFKAVG